MHAAGVEVADASLATATAWFEARPGHYSAVVISRPDNFVRFRSIIERTQPQAIKVIDVEAIYSRRTAMHARLLGNGDGTKAPVHDQSLLSLSARQRGVEFESWNWADIVVCVSADEAAEVRRTAPISASSSC